MASKKAAKPKAAPSADNTGTLNEDDLSLLYFQRAPKIAAKQAQIEQLRNEVNSEFQLLKTETGITRGDYKFAQSLGKDDDKKIADTYRRRAMLARFHGHAIGVQGEMFDGNDRREPFDKARPRGKMAGLLGEPCKPEADPGTEGYRGYMEGFAEGQTILARGIKKLTPKPIGDQPSSAQIEG